MKEIPGSSAIVPNPDDTPASPKTTELEARFLAWLKKRGGVQDLEMCQRKWSPMGLDVESSIKNKGTSVIRIGMLRGEKVVVLLDKSWAAQWVSYYEVDIPHHRQMQSLQK